MRRLTSPSALFGIWTLLFLLPVLPIVIRRMSEPHVTHVVSLPAPGIMKPFALLAALMPVLRFAPLSYPFFAVVFAIWPLVARKSLDAALGRIQFALATLPAVLSVLIGATVVGWTRPSLAQPVSFSTTPHVADVFETILYTVSAFWLVSLAVFGYNVSRTLRNSRMSKQ